MIVYDLRCSEGHDFEGWFADSEAFTAQGRARQLSCPYCGETNVERQLSPLRIGSDNVSRDVGRQAVEPASDDAGRGGALRKLAVAQAEMLKRSTWVGERFASRARAMAKGDEPHATIHGQATIAEAKALHDDGIAAMPLPFPVVPPEKQN